MKLTVLGSGTSHGIPVIGCDCPVCRSSDKNNKRLRCSAYIEAPGNTDTDIQGNPFPTTNLVMDTGPEFRVQCLKYNVNRLDAVFISHSHADHCHGLDDLRIFSYKKEKAETPGDGLKVFCNSNTLSDLIYRFAYIFKTENLGGGIPKLQLTDVAGYSPENPIKIGSVEVMSVPMLHGYLKASGWVVRQKEKDGNYHSIAYLTDCSFIEDSVLKDIKKFGGIIDHVIIDGLRKSAHKTHCNFDQALAYSDVIGGKCTWLTHITHETDHKEIQEYIDSNLGEYKKLSEIVRNGGSVAPAYDGLVIETNL